MAKETDRQKDFEEAYNQAWSAWSSWQEYAKTDLQSYLNHCWTSKDKKFFDLHNREMMSFPLIRRTIRLISGYQRAHRLAFRYDPIEQTDDITAYQMTALVQWAMNYCKGYNIISDAFEGSLITGINLINVYNDRLHNTYLDRLAYNQFLLDPNFRKRDLSDCHYGIIRKQITADEAKILLPDKEKEIDDISAKTGDDGKFSNMPRMKLYNEALLNYDEFQRRTTVRQKTIIDRFSGQEHIWEGTEAQLKIILANFPQLTTVTNYVPSIEVTAYLNGQEIGHEIDPFGVGDFSFTPVIGLWYPESDSMETRLQGLVRGLKDSQRASDKRIMAMISVFEQQIGPGLDYEEGTLVDEEDAFKTGPGKPRKFKKGALTTNAARDRLAPEIGQSSFQLQQLFEGMIPKIVNLNDEMFGMPEKGNLQIAGVLAKLRQGAGLIGLQDLFDNLSLSQSVIGTKYLKLVQQWPIKKIIRVLNQQPAPAFYNQDFGTYDCVCVEGILTDTQRNGFYNDLISLKELGGRLGDPAPVPWSAILKYSPTQVKPELMQEIQRIEQQNAQNAQKQQALQNTIQQLAIEQSKATINSENTQSAERITQSIQNQASANLDKIKTAQLIAESRQKGVTDLLKLAVDLEKTRINANSKREAASYE